MTEILFKDEVYTIIGSCFEVHKNLGPGFLEAVYQEALAIEFSNSNIPFEKEKVLDISYKGRLLNKKYVSDFVCYSKVIVELKAMEGLSTEHVAQVLNYLKATGFKLGLLINFGTPKLQYQRIIL